MCNNFGGDFISYLGVKLVADPEIWKGVSTHDA